MNFDDVVQLVLSIVLTVGVYQFYFFPQRHPIKDSIRLYISKIDKIVPFKPQWIWVYSGLYYPVILLLVFTIDSFVKFNYIAFSFIVLLIFQILFFYFFPTETPELWRKYEDNKSISLRFLRKIQVYDKRSNCFPSMHVSVATLTAFHLKENTFVLFENFSYFAFVFPIAIGLSALYTKQHYFIDIPSGIVLGYFSYFLYTNYY